MSDLEQRARGIEDSLIVYLAYLKAALAVAALFGLSGAVGLWLLNSSSGQIADFRSSIETTEKQAAALKQELDSYRKLKDCAATGKRLSLAWKSATANSAA
jgi:hypothetical protein